MIKKTFKELREIDNVYGRLLTTEGFQNTKLAYAFKRFSDKNTVKIFKDFNELMGDLRLDNALVDEKTKAVLYNDDKTDYQYTKESSKILKKESSRLVEEWDKKEFEVEPFICNELGDEELNQYDQELLEGVIINVIKE